MYYKAVLFLTFFVCITRASVVVNIFDDDVDSDTVDSPVRSCNLRWCDQQCRRMGFKGGVCVGERCKCDILVNEIGEVSDVDADISSLRSCNNRWCDQNCRRMGFTGGVCVGDRCKCDINKIGDISDIDASGVEEASFSLKSCNLRWCDYQCKKIRFKGGVCIRDHCKCYFNKIGEVTDVDADIVSLRICNNRWCDQNCRRMGFTGGACVGDRCKCDINKIGDISDVEASGVEEASFSLKSCNLRWCDQNCRRMGFTGGVCVGDRCKCDNNKIRDISDVDASDVEEASFSLKSCNLRWCEQNCRRMGFAGGACVGNRCKCDIRKIGDISDIDASGVEEASFSLKSCNLRWCEQNCRRMGFTGGACVGNRCKCDINKSEDIGPMQPNMPFCFESTCNQVCRRQGFARGTCIGTRCECHIFLASENKSENEIPVEPEVVQTP